MNRIDCLLNKTKNFCDAVIIQNGIDRYYFTGFSSSAGTLLLSEKARIFLVDSRYIQAAREKIKGCQVILEENLPQQLGQLIKEYKIKTVGFETHALSFQAARALEEMVKPAELLKDDRVSDAILEMRMIKDQKELSFLREAQRITDYAFHKCLSVIRAGVTKLDVMIAMGEEMARQGCEKRSFNMILTSGAQTALPHGDPTDTVIQKGDFVMMDVGAMVGGYAADMTRTVAVGAVSGEQRAVYQTVLDAQESALKEIRAGKCCQDIDRIARDLIDISPYKGTFGHGLGHSLGLEIHESPRFNPTCKTILRPGMMMTVEPGIYLPGKFGVRIEDMAAVTEDGCEDMTGSPKNLMIL